MDFSEVSASWIARQMHDGYLAQSLLNAKERDLWSILTVFKDHAQPTFILTSILVISSAITLIIFIIMLSFLMTPLKRSLNDKNSHYSIRSIMTVIIMLIAIISFWENIGAFQLYNIDDKVENVFEAIMKDKNHLYQELRQISDETLNSAEMKSIMTTFDKLKQNVSQIDGILQKDMPTAGSHFGMLVKKSAVFSRGRKKIKRLSHLLNSIDIKDNLQSWISEQMVKSVNPFLENIKEDEWIGSMKESTINASKRVKQTELARMTTVTILLFSILATTTILLFTKRKRMAVMLIFGISILFMVVSAHLLMGVVLGSFCDGIDPASNDQLAVKINGDMMVSGKDVLRMATYCQNGSNMLAAMLRSMNETVIGSFEIERSMEKGDEVVKIKYNDRSNGRSNFGSEGSFQFKLDQSGNLLDITLPSEQLIKREAVGGMDQLTEMRTDIMHVQTLLKDVPVRLLDKGQRVLLSKCRKLLGDLEKLSDQLMLDVNYFMEGSFKRRILNDIKFGCRSSGESIINLYSTIGGSTIHLQSLFLYLLFITFILIIVSACL